MGEESIVHLSTTFWKRYVDDTLTALRQDKVQRFNEHLNTIETTLQFTVEMEIEGTLPFLDTRVTHHFDGSLSTTVVKKNTHTDKCLDFQSHHPLAHKGPVARTLFNCAEKICSEFPDSKKEKEQVEKVLQNNGYPRRLVVASTITRSQLPKQDPPTATVTQLYIHHLSKTIRRILAPLRICTYFKPHRTSTDASEAEGPRNPTAKSWCGILNPVWFVFRSVHWPNEQDYG